MICKNDLQRYVYEGSDDRFVGFVRAYVAQRSEAKEWRRPAAGPT